MKKFIHISIQPDGELTIDFSRGLDAADMLEALSIATRIAFKKIIAEEAQRLNTGAGSMEQLARLIAKQKNPERN
jgi:hypothetical protein